MNGNFEPPAGGAVFTALDFVKCHKYPPSLLYVLMTVGPAIFLMGCLDRPPGVLPTDPITKRVLRTPLGHEIAFDEAVQSIAITTLPCAS